MSEKYKFHEPEGLYFVTSTVVHWIDLFARKHIESDHFLDQKLADIHNNPVESKNVEEPEHYLFSSSIDYSGIKGQIDLDLLD